MAGVAGFATTGAGAGLAGAFFSFEEDEESEQDIDEESCEGVCNVRDCLQSINLNINVDDHWDCYCKTRKVCGCGCDARHDGW